MRLRGSAGKQIKESVTIIQEEKYPFKIVNIEAKQGVNIDYKLKEIIEPKGIKYILTVENTKKEKGKYYDTIHLITSNTLHPVIKIRVRGNILDRKEEG